MSLDRAEIIEIVQGKAYVIQDPNFDVLLKTPKGAYGTAFTTVHTNHRQFLYLIPDSDCLISPVFEYAFHTDTDNNAPEGLFSFFIPHAIPHDIAKF